MMQSLSIYLLPIHYLWLVHDQKLCLETLLLLHSSGSNVLQDSMITLCLCELLSNLQIEHIHVSRALSIVPVE